LRPRGGRVACGPSGWSPWSVGQWRLWRGHRSGSTSGITAGEETKRRTPAREGWGSSCGSEVAEHVHAAVGRVLHGVVMAQVTGPGVPVEVPLGIRGPPGHHAGGLGLNPGVLPEALPVTDVALKEVRYRRDVAGALRDVASRTNRGA